MLLLFIACCLYSWWAQRDAYRTGIAVGRLQARAEVLEQIAQQAPPRLQLIRGGRR